MRKFEQKLIDYWCDTIGRYGLTIPFLVGATRIAFNDNNYSISDLLENLKVSETNYFISDCPELDELIIGTQKAEYSSSLEGLKNYGAVYIRDIEELEKTESFEELCKILDKKYSSKIENNLFSKDYDLGNWGYFTKEDLEIIEIVKL